MENFPVAASEYCYSGRETRLWPTGLVADSYSCGTWGAYAASNDINVPVQNLLLNIESAFG